MSFRYYLGGLLILILTINFSGICQIPNGDFESWSGNSPTGWLTYTFYNNVTPSTTAHGGTYSARAEIVNFYGNPAAVALQAGSGGTGFTVTQRHASVTGYYQFNSVGGDKLYIGVLMYKGKGLTGTLVGSTATIITTSTVSTWTQFTATLTYLNANNVDTCIIQFQILGPGSGSDFHVGSYALIDDLTFSGVNAVGDDASVLPREFALEQNYPNPFNPSTTIHYSLPVSAHVTLKVFNVLGEEVASLIDAQQGAGRKSIVFSADNLPAGIYLYRLTAGEYTDTKRLILIK